MENPQKIYVTQRLIIIFLSFILLCKNVIRKGSAAINLRGHGEKDEKISLESLFCRGGRRRRRNQKGGRRIFSGLSLSASRDNLEL